MDGYYSTPVDNANADNDTFVTALHSIERIITYVHVGKIGNVTLKETMRANCKWFTTYLNDPSHKKKCLKEFDKYNKVNVEKN